MTEKEKFEISEENNKEFDEPLTNVVATFRLMFEDENGYRHPVYLNIRKITIFIRYIPICYNPETLAALRIRTKLDSIGLGKTTALGFSTGKFVQAGATSEEQALIHAWHVAKFFSNVFGDIPFIIHNFRITNMVSSIHLNYSIDLWKLDEKLGPKSKYSPYGTPDAFPACRIRNLTENDNNEVSLVYMSGEAVLTGAKTRVEIETMRKTIIGFCEECKLDSKTLTILDKNTYRLQDRNKYSKPKNIEKLNKQLRLFSEETEIWSVETNLNNKRLKLDKLSSGKRINNNDYDD